MKGSNILDTNRLETLMSYDIMDTHPEVIYDEITSLAASICDTPTSLISLVDDKRQFFKSHFGLDINGTPLEDSFCKHVIADDINLLVVEDTHKDKRFRDYNLVKNDPNIGFYAGASLTTENGQRLGTLCVLDYKPKQLSEVQIKGLQTLANQVIQLFELRKSKKIEEDQKIDLEQKGKLLNNIVNATGIGIWERNLCNDSLTLNEQALDIYGINKASLSEFKTDTWFSLIHKDDLEEVKKKMLACLSYPSSDCSVQYRMLQKDGTYKWIQDKGKVLQWSDNKKPQLMYGTVQDITEKKNYTTELQRVKNNQEAMINSTKDLMWSIDLEYRLITANTAFHQLVNKIQGQPFNEGDLVFSDQVAAQVTKKWKSYYKKVLTSGPFSIKQKIQDPKKFWTTYGLTSFDLLYNKEGEKTGITCFSKDITSEVLSQQVLINSKEELQKIMDTSLDIICTIDEEGYFLSINKACKQIWGYEPKDIIGTRYLELVYDEDIKLTEDSAESVLSGKKVVNFENRYMHKNGAIIPMLWSSNWDKKDRVYYCIARDNTEKKKAELLLKNSERRFKTLVQESSDIISIVDLEGIFTYVSPSTMKVLGAAPERYIGTNAFDYIHVNDVERVKERFSSILDNDSVEIDSFRFKDINGEWKWFENIITNQLNEPSINGLVVTTRDITAKRKAEEKLENSERRYKTLVQEGSDMICIVDEKAIFSYASPTSTKILNITPEEFVGTNAFNHVHPDDYDTVYNEFMKVLDIPQVNIKPFRFKHGSGHWVWLETAITNKLDEPTIKGIVVNSKDVTTKVQHLNAIEEQNAQLKKIAWTQSHIVRAPVARLMGLINLLTDDKGKLNAEEKEQVLNYIFTSADEIDHIIRDIVENTINVIDIEENK
ncbi:PAS domain S-box protein [Maribacter sp. 1_MG-2023]|uniref:PAS domain S-box protein n=1 Tax=Maribacter sp. 1_MG-2023 TaxID=3062677 RepID=UPI0026E12AD1|nr:PAS domain S-box protein [Maribacter sp. 1_MG-2023]MDO6471192.1 PAS domain S-box protein [Maribacter sp. 1_MG-2023]